MITGNEPAMPNVAFDKEGIFTHAESEGHYGLTIRQHFAAIAMQGVLASCDIDNNPFISPVDCATQSVKYADALIAELNKEKP